jgi:hypothetical protein
MKGQFTSLKQKTILFRVRTEILRPILHPRLILAFYFVKQKVS